MHNKKTLFLVFLSVLLLSIISIALLLRQRSSNQTKKITNRLSNSAILADKPFVNVNDNKIYVEIADTPQARKNGLSGREFLGENEGMLFVFDKDTYPAFWMKDMNFSIDIIWIDDSQIVGIEENVPAPIRSTPESQLPLYRPDEAIDHVLEVNAGFSDKNGIEVGDVVDLSNL